jgi:DNA primase
MGIDAFSTEAPMGRIPEDELERIKRETDLVALVRARGIELKPHGKDLIGTCIFHPDQTPSLVITPGRNLFHCFGCGAAGTPIDWVMRTEGVTFRHAVEILRSGGPQPSPGAPPLKRSQAMKLPSAVDPATSDEELMRQVIAYYHATLKTSPEALAYLAKRGIDAPEAIDAFQLGFANRTLGFRLPQKTCDDGIKIRHRLTKLGILRSTGHEHFTGCLVIPILDAEGHVAGVYGRRIIRNPPAGSPPHLYLPGPHRGVFNLAAFRASKDIILCEALIDALTFYCAGFANVTSSYGVHGFTPEHLEAMKAYGAEQVLLAYDRDAAGDAAAAELAGKLAAEGITTFRVLFPHGMDANDYAVKVKPAAQSLAVLLASATYMAGPTAERPTIEPYHPAPQLVEPPASSLVAASEPAAEAPEPLDAEPAAELLALTTPATNINIPPPQPPPLLETTAAEMLPPPVAATPPPSPIDSEPAPTAPAPPPDIPAEVSETQVVIRLGPRYWRVRGLAKNTSFEQLRVNVFVGLDGAADRFHQDTLDLYSAKQRQAFVKQAAAELGGQEEAIKKDLGTVLLKLEQLQELAIAKALEPKKPTITIDDKDRQAAMDLLRDPRLLDRILADFERCGVVGEETNKLVGYLAAVSRKLDRPLAVMVQSSSAAGKSALMNACLAFVPEEERVAYSAMTGQSLFYMAETDLEHKVLAIAEEEGAERASYALKQLQSEGELSIASTGKDPQTGRLVTHEYRVKGPAAIVMTTTAIDLDEELLNRCLVLTVNEDREQTRAIHRMQREAETLEGYLAELDKTALLTLHRNSQRLLRPLRVVNPYARRLTFLDDRTRTRRDHMKYLGLIRAIALLHQHQRPVKSGLHHGEGKPYIEVELSDIEAANRLAHEVLGRTLDELPPQTRRFLFLLDAMATEACAADRVSREEYRFTRADARRATGWSLTQVKAHLDRLCEMEYALIHRGARGQSFVYELLYAGEGQAGEPFLMGLLDVDTLRGQQRLEYGSDLSAFSPRVSDSRAEMSGSKRPQNGAKTGGFRTAPNPEKANSEEHPAGMTPETAENARLGSPRSRSSHALDRGTPGGPLFAAAGTPRRP